MNAAPRESAVPAQKIQRVTFILLFAALCTLAAGGPALAGSITLQITAHTQYREGQVKLRLALVNRGDEAAKNLRAVGLGQAQGVRSGLLVLLPPGQKGQLELSWPVSDPEPGRHLVALRVEYQDLNGYPLSALAWGYYRVGQDLISPLRLTAQPLSLADSARAMLTVANPTDVPLSVRLKLFAPRELSASLEPAELQLPARGRAEVELKLKRLSGQIGSRYQLLVVLESRHGGLASFKPLLLPVSLVPQPPASSPPWWWWAGGGLILVLAAGLGWWLGRRRPRPKAKDEIA
jgi:hypothetical protein